jgi:hypothetical protein
MGNTGGMATGTPTCTALRTMSLRRYAIFAAE